ncbi:MAG TPA: YciI family protein [Rhizomicrobium sp.]
MQYMLLIYTSEAALAKTSQQEMGQVMAAYGAYTEALKKAGALVSADRLKSVSTATTVRVADGKTQVLNGPYAEIKEELGGYYLIEAPDLDAAIGWAARCPASAQGAVEVRPVWTM